MSGLTVSKPTYAFCPSSSAAELPSEHAALAAFLGMHGYSPAERHDASPDLLVIAPPSPRLALTKSHLGPEDLRVFQEGSGGRVLYVQPELRSPSGSVPHEHGVFVFGNRRTDDITKLRVWLGEAAGWKKPPVVEYICKAIDLARKMLYGSDGREDSRHFLEYTAREFPGSGLTCGAPDPPWWDTLYGLFHIAGSYDVLEHDLNRYARYPFSQKADAHARIRQKREALNVAADLWKSLKAAAAFKCDTFWNGDTPRILVVDDNPKGIKDDIVPVIAALMPCYEVWCWNPTQRRPGHDNPATSAVFDHLIRYSSLTAGKSGTNGQEDSDKRPSTLPIEGDQELVTWSISADSRDIVEKAREKSLRDALKHSRFVLVDLLFKHKGVEDEYGAALIRGLRRFCVDHLPQGENGSLSLPRFVAFSRSDDLEKIQKALRAGASGYVLKNRLLSLPAELARLRAGTDQDRCLLHRNFHALDFLPNETRGLLHEVRVPRIRFDRPPHTQEDAEEYPPEVQQRMAALLRAIPKPDLHLHAGSCMTPEFLVIASIVMLAERHDKQMRSQKSSSPRNAKDWRTPLLDAIPPLFSFWSGTAKLALTICGDNLYEFDLESAKSDTSNTLDPVDRLGKSIRESIKEAIRREADKTPASGGRPPLRSILHARLGIRDHWSLYRACSELDSKDAVTLMLFAITTGQIQWGRGPWPTIDKKDVLRLFILFLASQYESPVLTVEGRDFVRPLRDLTTSPSDESALKKLGKYLGFVHQRADRWSDIFLKGKHVPGLALNVSLVLPRTGLLRACPSLKESPLEFLIASGTRGRNLAEYLAGCEYSGAEHLQRPCLMALYARQTLEYLVRHGVFYAELRAAVSGYVDKDRLTYQQACTLFREAFEAEQNSLMKAYRESISVRAELGGSKKIDRPQGWTWCTHNEDPWAQVFETGRSADPLERLFPTKVNLIFTGKRHKATREMLMEAAAGVVLNADSTSRAIAASVFTARNMTRCRVVGFDLAGLEESFPPEMFRAHFEQLSRMHIPITAHAGENASVRFVESAVLDLRARRLGHGLALADDEKLMARVRDERICIELCPVSNFQTNEFTDSKTGREYPLKRFLKFGNIVCLNTDNPIVSYTNIIKEFFQASYAYGGNGLSLWDALRLIRMGFAHSFKGLAERRALLELVEQMVFDLLIDPSVEDLLRKQTQDAASVRGRGEMRYTEPS